MALFPAQEQQFHRCAFFFTNSGIRHMARELYQSLGMPQLRGCSRVGNLYQLVILGQCWLRCDVMTTALIVV
jgi:hypothetical protein